MSSFQVSGNITDVLNKEIFSGTVEVEEGKIKSITRTPEVSRDNYILPGFIDAHVHVESSMLVPSEFARLAVIHGTVATVSDPHEIANVLGLKGIRYMIENGKKVPFKFYFGAPSCVPATVFETAGAELTADNIQELFEKDGLVYLSEMMNYPGVLNRDSVVMDKIGIARKLNRPIDGHAPGLKGEDAKRYIDAGISTDHECYTLEEALDKIKFGMKILIREGSAAKNYDALHTLIDKYPGEIMFCSDDKHPNDLVVSHIDETVRRSVAKGYNVFNVLTAACVNPVKHYKLDVGLLQKGDPADFIVVNDLKEFKVLHTFINGILTAENGKSLIEKVKADVINNFNAEQFKPGDFAVKAEGNILNVIETYDGQLITGKLESACNVISGCVVSDTDNDILKIVVINRYGSDEKPSVGFIKNFGFKKGAIASCVAHDSHNIIAVGVSDKDICEAVNAVIRSKGGISVSFEGKTETLPLPVAGIMTNEDGGETAGKYSEIDRIAKTLGTTLSAPFMTLSFMALLVIPSLKLSDKGLFDGGKFNFIDLFNK